jgi:SOS-response transcriptional repressor LexA
MDLRAQAKRPAEARFLRVVDATAGEPLYEPGEGCAAVIDAVWIEEERFRFLSMCNRYPIQCYFSLDERFFLVHVKGHSMNGGTYQIRDKDLLLAKWQNTRPAEREVAVFQEENSGPLVKIFRSHPGRIVLESANPRFKERTYYAHSPTLRVLGIARAILQPEQRN